MSTFRLFRLDRTSFHKVARKDSLKREGDNSMLEEQRESKTNTAQALELPEAVFPLASGPVASALIPPEDLLELEIIAQQIAGDLGLEVAVGTAGQGSYFSFSPPRITLDPAHILTDPELAKFVAGHEGAHRRFSSSPEDLLPVASELEELYGQLGFHATMNTIEDCAVNDGMSREVPGMAKYTTKNYFKADKEGLHIMTPEIASIMQQIGREPKFAQALAEITRDWHRWRKEGGYQEAFESLANAGRYRSGLDPSVLKALRNTRRAVRRAISSMPKVGEKAFETLKSFALNRLQIIRDKVYPEIRALIQEDIDLEAMRQALREDDASKDKKGSKGNESSISKQLSKSAKEEIAQVTEEFIKEKASEEAQEYKKLKDSLEQEQANQQKIEEELHHRSLGGKGSSSVEDLQRELAASKVKEQDLNQKVKERFSGISASKNPASSQAQEKLTEELIRRLEQRLKALGETPLPYDKLSKKTQRELEQAYKSLPEAQKEILRELAQQKLAELEHEIVQALKPKLEENSIETIHERRIREEQGGENEEQFQEQLKKLSQLQNKLERERQSTLEPFDRTYEDIAAEIQEATNRLERVLIPEAFFQWRKDLQTGARLNLGRALQAEADPRYLTKLFEQRLNPTQRTHALELLIDTSGSMDGQKIERAFQGVVFLACLCENLNLQFEVLEFNDHPTIRKEWSESVKDDSIRTQIAQSSRSKSAGTQDADAIKRAYARLQNKDATYRFIIVLTDAQSGAGEELKQILKKIAADENTVVVHFGIGQGTADSYGFYQHSFGDLSPSAFFKKFCDVIEDIILSPQGYFSKMALSVQN